MKNILVIGSINMDMVVSAGRVPLPGETVIGDDFCTLPGGKGANQAVAAAKLCGDVKMLCRVGNDLYGQRLLENLHTHGVQTPGRCVAEISSGIAVITVCGGENSIIVVRGANAEVTPAFIKENVEFLQWADIVVMQFEIPMETVLYAARKAKEHGCVTLINPAPLLPVPNELLQNTDILVLNEHEAGQMLGRVLSTIEEGKAAVSALLETDIGQIIITLGGQGAVYNSCGEIRHQPAFDVAVVDTTAAGDSFIGGICAGLCMGFSTDKAVLYATGVAAITVSSMGACASLPDAEQVEAFLRERAMA